MIPCVILGEENSVLVASLEPSLRETLIFQPVLFLKKYRVKIPRYDLRYDF